MGRHVLREKSFEFAIQVVNTFKALSSVNKEFVMSKQLLRSGTAVGALHREAEQAESKADFIHKLAIAQKECNESLYWIELLEATGYLNPKEFGILHESGQELIRLITSIIKSTKRNML